MKIVSALSIFVAAAQTSAFVAPSSSSNGVVMTGSSTAMNMGLFDFFSEEARQQREAKKQAEIEEQLRLQAEIYERRKNPEKMEAYKQKVYSRRELRMAGKDEEAAEITMYDGNAEKLKPTST